MKLIRCNKCNSRMIQVKLIDLKGQTYKALVCTYCGHISSKDRPFKGVNKERKAG